MFLKHTQMCLQKKSKRTFFIKYNKLNPMNYFTFLFCFLFATPLFVFTPNPVSSATINNETEKTLFNIFDSYEHKSTKNGVQNVTNMHQTFLPLCGHTNSTEKISVLQEINSEQPPKESQPEHENIMDCLKNHWLIFSAFFLVLILCGVFIGFLVFKNLSKV